MKTAAELGITERELEALIKTRCLLTGDLPDGNVFNMGTTVVKKECGTAACIGGWMGIAMGLSSAGHIDDYICEDRSESLRALFFPRDILVGLWSSISQETAIDVIDYFLETGEVCWARFVDETWLTT